MICLESRLGKHSVLFAVSRIEGGNRLKAGQAPFPDQKNYRAPVASLNLPVPPILFWQWDSFVAIFTIVVHHKIVLAEEQFLQKVFGDECLRYCGRVGRYL
jgi:protein-S-isoprenylcysteine O-methyltransferase Ste14